MRKNWIIHLSTHDIEIRPSPYSGASLGFTDSNGEVAAWITPGNYAFLAWSWSDLYHLALENVNITTATTLNMHAASMPTGQVTVNVSDFDSASFAVWADPSQYMGIGFSISGGETFIFSSMGYGSWIDMRKWQGSDQWEFSTSKEFMLADAEQLTINSGGDFNISTNVSGADLRTGPTGFDRQYG